MAKKGYDEQTLRTWIERIEAEADLTEWEEDFVKSVSGQLTARGSLSTAQQETLEKIYAQKTK